MGEEEAAAAAEVGLERVGRRVAWTPHSAPGNEKAKERRRGGSYRSREKEEKKGKRRREKEKADFA